MKGELLLGTEMGLVISLVGVRVYRMARELGGGYRHVSAEKAL